MRADRAYPRIVIIGGGGGGLYAAKALGSALVAVTLLDKRNSHLIGDQLTAEGSSVC